MSVKCPNKSSKEWQELTNNFGEYFAYIAYTANNNEIPSISQARDMIEQIPEDDVEVVTREVPKENPINTSEAYEFLKSYIPDLKKDEVQFVDQLVHGQQAGEFRNGIIYLYTNTNTTDAKILKHEAFHKIFNQYLPEQQKEKLLTNLEGFVKYKEFSNGDNSLEMKEEFLATEFQEYLGKGETLASLRGIFQKIKNFIYRLFNISQRLTQNNIDTIFDQIYRKQYSVKLVPNNDIHAKRYLKFITQIFPSGSKAESLQHYVNAKNYVKRMIKEYIEEGEDLFSAIASSKEDLRTLYTGNKELLNLETNEEIANHASTLEGTDKIIYFLNSKDAHAFNAIKDDLFPITVPKSFERMLELYGEDIDTGEQLNVEMIDNIMTNYEEKVSRLIKQELALIEVDGKFIDPSLAYVKTLQIYDQLDFGQSTEDVLDKLDELSLDKIQTAIVDNIRDWIIVGESTMPEGIDIRFKDHRYTFRVNDTEVNMNQPSSQIWEDAMDLGAEFEQLEKAYKIGKARQNYRQFYYELGSLVNNAPFVALLDTTDEPNVDDPTEIVVNTKFRLKEQTPAGIVSSTIANLKSYLRYNEDLILDDVLQYLGVRYALTEKEKKQAISILKNIKKVKGSGAEGYIKNFAELVTRNNDTVSAQNYIDAKKNRRYMWIMGSYFYDAYNHIKNSTGFLKGDNLISGYSAFVSRENGKPLIKLGRRFSLDALVYRKNSENINQKQYQNFNFKDYIDTHFFTGFIGMLERTKGKSYLQSTYTQSNRPSDLFVELSVGDQKTLEQINSLHKQQYNHRQDVIKTVKRLEDDLSNYDNWSDKKKEFWKNFAKVNYNKVKDNIITDLDTIDTAAESSYIKLLDNYQGDFSNITEQINKVATMIQIPKEIVSRSEGKVHPKLYQLYNVFYRNNYVQGHQLNMHVFGDIALGKNATDIIKRMQGIGSPGKKQLTNELGTQPKMRVVTAKDYEYVKDEVEDVKGIYKRIHGMDVEQTDAVTFGTPSTLAKIQEGSGDTNLGNIIKPVTFFIDEHGITHYNKTALFVITDELRDKFPRLAQIRKDMEDNQIDYYTFKSAYKVGAPISQVKNGEKIKPYHITEWETQHTRIQGNPLHHESEISNYSQFNYFINQPTDTAGNTQNEEEAQEIYNIDAEIMRTQLDILYKEKNLFNEDGSVNSASVRKLLKDNVTDRVYELLEEGLDINYPSVHDGLIIQLASIMSKNSVEIKHTGNKLVNQSDLGVKIYTDGRTFADLSVDEKKQALSFYNLPYNLRQALSDYRTVIDQGGEFTTVKQWKKFFKKHDKIDVSKFKSIWRSSAEFIPRNLLMRDKDGFTEVIAPYEIGTTGVAVRIPTTGVHSGIALKVVGRNEDNNGVIVPAEIIAIHGSDFDIDSLYFIRKEDNVDGLDLDTVSKRTDIKSLKQKVQLLKNKKIDLYMKVLTKPENAEEVNTPIEFAAIKVDIEAVLKGNVPQYMIESLGEKAYKQLQKQLKLALSVNKKGETVLDNKKLKENVSDTEQKIKLTNTQKENINNLRFSNPKWNNYSDEQIQSFVNSIYPNSPSHNILYHIGGENITKFDKNMFGKGEGTNAKGLGVYFQEDPYEIMQGGIGIDYFYESENPVESMLKDKILTLAIADIKSEDVFNPEATVPDEIVIRNPDRIYILTSEQALKDIEQFFSEISTKNQSSLNTTNIEESSTSLVNKVLNSRMGVKLKMQLIKNKYDLQDSRDLNKFDDQFKYYKDNFEGRSGTGIEANVMKAVSYLMQGSGVSENKKVKLKGGIGEFTIDGKVYDHLVSVAEDGSKTTETSDTVLNGYIDNVKEQVTWLMNANRQTIPKIGLMIYMGIPLDRILYIMNQPIIKRYIEGSHLQKKDIENSLEGVTNKEITTEGLINSLQGDEDLDTQLAVFNFFKSMDKYVDEMTTITNQLNILKSLPIDTPSLRELLKKDSLRLFESPEFYKIPHIAQGLDSVRQLLNIVEDQFILESPKFQEVIDTIRGEYLQQASGEVPVDTEIKRELQKFILSSYIAELRMKGEIPIYDDTNGLSQNEYWTQEFIKDFEKYRSSHPNNVFLTYFSVEQKSENVKKLSFYGGTNLQEDNIVKLVSAYLQLPPKLKRKFIIHSVMNDGSQFGFKGFTNLLSYNNTDQSVKDGIQEAADYYTNMLKELDFNVQSLRKLFVDQFVTGKDSYMFYHQARIEQIDSNKSEQELLNEQIKYCNLNS